MVKGACKLATCAAEEHLERVGTSSCGLWLRSSKKMPPQAPPLIPVLAVEVLVRPLLEPRVVRGVMLVAHALHDRNCFQAKSQSSTPQSRGEMQHMDTAANLHGAAIQPQCMSQDIMCTCRARKLVHDKFAGGMERDRTGHLVCAMGSAACPPHSSRRV